MMQVLSGLVGAATEALARLTSPAGGAPGGAGAGGAAGEFRAALDALLAPGAALQAAVPAASEGEGEAADAAGADGEPTGEGALVPSAELLAALRVSDVSPMGAAPAAVAPADAAPVALARADGAGSAAAPANAAPAAVAPANAAPAAVAPANAAPVALTRADAAVSAALVDEARVVLAPMDAVAVATAPMDAALVTMAPAGAAQAVVTPAGAASMVMAPAGTAVAEVESEGAEVQTRALTAVEGEGAERRTPAPAEVLKGTAAEPEAIPDPRRVERGLARLDTEFRGRLERVIDRMREEFGHEVKVVETFRDQARQEYLYAQGRSRPGPVVTWTRDSNHSQGLAADLVIDGSYDNPVGFARLARIARAEGLRTLGARDPGHVELADGSRPQPRLAGATGDSQMSTLPAARTVAPLAEAAPGVAAPAEVATVARVAQVAQVAQVARVAEVARVATPGVARSEERQAQPAGVEVQSVEGASAPDLAATLAGTEPAAPRAALAGGAEGPRAAFGAEAMDRVARVLDLRETLAERPLSQMVLRVENAQGTVDHIRVGVRGNAVDTTIDLGSRGELDPLSSRATELQRALERHGLESEAVRVRSNPSQAEVSELARTVAALSEADQLKSGSSRPGGDSLPQRGRQTPEREAAQDRSDDSRHRSRQEHKQEKNP